MERLTLLSTSKSEIKQIIKDRIEDEASPIFVDVDTDLGVVIYYGDLSGVNLGSELLAHLYMLVEAAYDCDYILITV